MKVSAESQSVLQEAESLRSPSVGFQEFTGNAVNRQGGVRGVLGMGGPGSQGSEQGKQRHGCGSSCQGRRQKHPAGWCLLSPGHGNAFTGRAATRSLQTAILGRWFKAQSPLMWTGNVKMQNKELLPRESTECKRVQNREKGTTRTNLTYFLSLLSGAAVKSPAQCPRLCQYMVIHKAQILVTRFLTCVCIRFELKV